MPRMRICIDARMMGAEKTRGIGRYTEELVRAMIAETSEDVFIVVVRSSNHPFANHPRVETVVADIPWYTWREQMEMPKIFDRVRADVFHVPHWNVPFQCPRPLVITIHDLILRHTPASAKSSTRGWFVRTINTVAYRLILSRAIWCAECIVIPTEFVKNDVARFYPSATSRLIVSGEGMPMLDLATKPLEADDSQPQPFLLSVGSAYPHKGLEDVLKAWPRIRSLFPDLEWHIVGELDVFMERLRSKARDLDGIIFRGRLTGPQLNTEYTCASALIFPSHDEGFGLPVLEAIAHGCPVISSTAGPLREVLGEDGAMFFPTGEISGIISAVQVFFREQEVWREQTAKIAPKLAEKHAWTHAARLTLEAYRAVHTRS